MQYAVSQSYAHSTPEVEQDHLATSDWSTLLGQTNPALLDGSTLWQNVPGQAPPNRMTVVTAATAPGSWTATPNVVRVEALGSTGNTFVQSLTNIPSGVDLYMRLYINGGWGTHATGHSIKMCVGESPALIQVVLWAFGSSTSTTYRPFVNFTEPGPHAGFLGPVLDQLLWYRFEWWLQIVNVGARTFKLWPRIYDASNNLIADSDDYNSVGVNGVLTNWLNAGNGGTASDLDQLRRWAVGYEGPGGGPANPGFFTYYAAAAVRLAPLNGSVWVGPR